MEVPSFLKEEGDSLLFNLDNKEFAFIVSEQFFDGTSKSNIAEIVGQYVSMIGLCNWTIIDNNGKMGEIRLFQFPTMFLCKPYTIEKVKDLKIDGKDAGDYRLLKFRKGDEVVSQTRVPQLIDNVELFFKLAVITAKIPTAIPYDTGWQLFIESMDLNGSGFDLNAQLFGLVWSVLCRDPQDISREFRFTDMKDMHGYKPISIKLVPKYISPYTALVSENFDESIRSAVLMKDRKEEDLAYSPLEKIITQ